MRNPTKDGGPAFPVPVTQYQGATYPMTGDPEYMKLGSGMSLRAYFAGQALLGLLSDPNNMSNAGVNAQAAVVSADALIAELAKGTTQ